MRIVIDFLDGLDAVDGAALALVKDLVRTAAGADIRLAVPDGPAAYEALQLAFIDLLPRAHLRPFALHGAGHLRALQRRHAFIGMAPDVVLVLSAHATAAADGALPQVTLDPALDAATLLARLAAAAAAPALASPSASKPRLAYISPLPPERSGIADYSAELAPELARYYDVELVVAQEQVLDARLAGLPQHSVAWFQDHAHEYDRVLYHFGNSPVHKHMFDLIRAAPGVVVLHDFYFGNVIDFLEHQGHSAQGFVRALYESHGYTGLLGLRKEGRNPTVWTYPVNRGILDHAAGVLVHSDYPQTLAQQWYGSDAAADWRGIPLLRGKPDLAAAPEHGDARAAARARLGIAPDAFVVCSFGMLGPTKLNKELVAAFMASPLAADPRCALVFVGENDPGLYGAELLKTIRAGAAAERIRITGFADAAAYADYLAACDVAVQLRRASRGETSAAVLDCLLYGVPTIVNAHGSTASLADDLLVKLPDHFATAELADALARLRADPALRADLSQRAAAHMQAEHAPAHAGRLCFEAIEHFARRGEPAAYAALVAEAAPLCPEPELAALAGAIAFNRPAPGPRQLLVDVSALVQKDLKTGIQRVVRSILLALIAAPPAGFRIEPVFSTGGNRGYYYARKFGLGLVDAATLALEDAPVELRPGDIFFGLDLLLSATAQNEPGLQAMRARGVEVYFCMYDVLPVLRPDVFPFGTDEHFELFLRSVHRMADGIICISRAVADELAGWFAAKGLTRALPLQLGWFHLGADIDASAPSHGLPPDAARVLDALKARPSFLMVGTVEPRKGHAQALAAFEQLWEQDVDVNLVVVGKEGWMVEAVAARMASHPEKGRRLFWLAGISDEMLLKLYAGAAALLAPSEGEGFGLPLIEAAQHGTPILARDLPVFREVAGDHAWYFDGLAPADLAQAVTAWLAASRAGQAPPSTGLPWLTWEQSAQQVVDTLIGGHWYRTLPGHLT